MKWHCSILVLIMTGLISTCWAQNQELLTVMEYELAGHWTGTLSQGGSTILAPKYDFELIIRVKGEHISGHSIIRVDGNFASIKFKGKKKGLKVDITEYRISQSSIKENYFWCLKNLHLEFGYENGRYRLKGLWDGKNRDRDCNPGSAVVYKETTRA